MTVSQSPKTIVLDKDDTAFVDAQIRSGQFETADQVVHAGLRLLRAEEARLEDLRALIDEADAEIARGEGLTFKSREELLEAITARRDISSRRET